MQSAPLQTGFPAYLVATQQTGSNGPGLSVLLKDMEGFFVSWAFSKGDDTSGNRCSQPEPGRLYLTKGGQYPRLFTKLDRTTQQYKQNGLLTS